MYVYERIPPSIRAGAGQDEALKIWFFGVLATHKKNTGAPTRKGELFQYDGPLSEVDPEVASIISNEKNRQVRAQSEAAENSSARFGFCSGQRSAAGAAASRRKCFFCPASIAATSCLEQAFAYKELSCCVQSLWLPGSSQQPAQK